MPLPKDQAETSLLDPPERESVSRMLLVNGNAPGIPIGTDVAVPALGGLVGDSGRGADAARECMDWEWIEWVMGAGTGRGEDERPEERCSYILISSPVVLRAAAALVLPLES